MNEMPFVKGHGTGKDFVIIPNVDGRLELTTEQVRWVCDRHRGIGANGVLRVVRTEHVPERRPGGSMFSAARCTSRRRLQGRCCSPARRSLWRAARCCCRARARRFR